MLITPQKLFWPWTVKKYLGCGPEQNYCVAHETKTIDIITSKQQKLLGGSLLLEQASFTVHASLL